ncbi:MAG: DASS family sodium-coupled anion symporter, partial [Candidatus Marinimicrobia bacterium]|nr:DASS family sodium-coupled anion symporter [Candidatus Neomarinimicrobiota bacterium]
MGDTRRAVRRQWGDLEFSSGQAVLKIIGCIILAWLIALLPAHPGLDPAGRWALFILILAAGLWATEAIPAFSVALVVIALEIMILGKPDGVFASTSTDWEIFLRPWGSPIIWLFFAGLVLGEAAQTTGLDRLFSRYILQWFGATPGGILFGAMCITFLFSMFMSNTAATAMMVAVMAPVVGTLKQDTPYAKSLLLGIPFAANVGGMGTIIGSPPNAIAAGLLMDTSPINFTLWMMAGLPPALVLFFLAYLYLRFAYPTDVKEIDISGLDRKTRTGDQLPLWKRLMVMPVFICTILLWMTGPFHHIPTSVVAFLPITVFAAAGIITVKEIRQLHWDVLLLLAGGLSLGIAVRETGLAVWLVDQLPTHLLGQVTIAFALSYFTMVLSNFMSHTAASNILVPIGMALAVGFEPRIVIPIALGASTAM